MRVETGNNSQKHILVIAKKKKNTDTHTHKKALEPAHWNLGSPEESVASDKCVLQNSVQKRQLNMEEY